MDTHERDSDIDNESHVSFDAPAIDVKWRAIWEQERQDVVDLDRAKHPFYNLMMFPYPSAEKLHIGNFYAYCGADIFGRYQRLNGKDVFEPMGFDAFGIHSENYAMKVGAHPVTLTAQNVEYFREQQLKKLGLMLDWSHEVNTTDPSYYRWTQWLFLQLFNAGLAEHRAGPVKWCPSCLTVLADEQVISGHCERCDSVVEQRFLKQWFLKTTAYAQALLDGLDGLDWTEKTKIAQRNWIGRSEGGRIHFTLRGCATTEAVVFTTRPDTIMGSTFLVVGADHPDLASFVAPACLEAVETWKSSLPVGEAEPNFERGIDLGTVAIHPVTQKELPVYAAQYVLGAYGTGVIMAVPAHDERDWVFAHFQGLPIIQVVQGGDTIEGPYVGTGKVINSGPYDGLDSSDAQHRIIDDLAAKGAGAKAVQYRLRDWLISRQRYWGPPIPIIHCPTCGPVGVPEDQLPVELPYVEAFRPQGTGTSPLATVAAWVNVPCPTCGEPAKRETDVSDNFVDSAWYFLRYPSTEWNDRPFDLEMTKKWLPVDMYIGGNEHAVLHLLYARFVMRALYDLGHVPTQEPFTVFRAHGLLIKDGAKISKNKGNVVNPDEYVARYGADTIRLFLMFLGPYTEGGDWRDSGIRGITRFLERVWGVVDRIGKNTSQPDLAVDREREQRRHRCIDVVDREISALRYNTAIAFLMEYTRDLLHEEGAIRLIDVKTLLQLLAPFAPHLTEEWWHHIGHTSSIHVSSWPHADPEFLLVDEETIVVQVNGKLRAQFVTPRGTSTVELQELACKLPRIIELLQGAVPQKIVVVPGKLVNIVT